MSRNHRVVVSLDVVKGTLILLSLHISIATLTLFLELEVRRVMTKAMTKPRRQVMGREGKQLGMSNLLHCSPYPPIIIQYLGAGADFTL